MAYLERISLRGPFILWALYAFTKGPDHVFSGITRNSGALGQNIKVRPLPSTVTCIEVRGVVLSTAAPGKVLKIDSYFCRR